MTDDADACEPAAPAAAPVGGQFTGLEVVRMIGRVLTLSARQLGISMEGLGLHELCGRIILAAQRKPLDPAAYRLVWIVRSWMS